MQYEVEASHSLIDVVRQEMTQRLNSVKFHKIQALDGLAFTHKGSLETLLNLKTVNAVYALLRFDIARPTGLLGHQNFQKLHHHIKQIRALYPENTFKTFHLSAAGSDTPIMLRLRDEIAHATQLESRSEGDLLIRVRRTPELERGWDVLIRLTPRPLATRDWRVVNMEGALNAAVAHAMIHLSDPEPYDNFLNIGCGSGTLLIERALYGGFSQALGCDIDDVSIGFSQQNIGRSGIHGITLLQADGRRLPIREDSINRFTADLPFGQSIGSHDDNLSLYPAILAESARIAVYGAKFVLISHEIRLMERLLHEQNYGWRSIIERKINLSGLHPHIYVLEWLP